MVNHLIGMNRVYDLLAHGWAQTVAEQAHAIERLVAFLGRPVSTGR